MLVPTAGLVGPLFQSTPLQEGRPSGCRSSTARAEFQSTPLQEGRHQELS